MDDRKDEIAGRDALLQVQRQRALRAEARRKEIEARLQAALDEAEEHRIVAIELRTMLDATYYRISTLEEEVRVRERDTAALSESHAADIERLGAAAEEARRRLAEVEEHRGEVERLARGLETAAEIERALQERLGATDAELTRAREELAQTRGALCREQWAHASNLESLRDLVAEQTRQIVGLGARLEEAGETSAALEGRLGEVLHEAARRAQDGERLASALATVQAERDHWRHEWQGAAGAMAELQREGETDRARARDTGERAERAEERLVVLQAEIEALRADLTASQERLRGGQEWTAALEAEIETLEQERALLKRLREDDADGIRLKEAALGDALEAGARLWRELADSLRTRESAQVEVERLEECVRSLSRQLEGESAERTAQAAARRALEERVRFLESAAAAREEAAAELSCTLERRDAELAEARVQLEEAERVYETECERLRARVEQVGHDRVEIEDRLAAVEQLRQELAQQVTALRGQLEERERDLFQLRCGLEEMQGDRDRSREVEARLAEERDAAARRCCEAEDRSAALQREIEELRCSTAAWIPPDRQGEMEAEIEQLRGAVAAAQDKEVRLQEVVDDLQQQLLREQAHSAALWSDLESQNRFREALDSALAEARARYGELESALQREQRRWSEREATERESAEETASLLARAQLLEVRATEVEAEREALRDKVERLEASCEGFERECEQLRRRASQGDDREAARLQSRIEELERQHREAVQRHSGAVSGYMLELNQRTETLRQRDAEIHRLSEELQMMQGACDDAVAQLADLKDERDSLAERVRDLETSRPAPPGRARPAAPTTAAQAPPSAEPPQADKAPRSELRLADEAPVAEEKKRAPQTPSPPRRQEPRHLNDEPLWLLHAEEDASLQEVVQSTVAKFPSARCTLLSSEGQERVDGRAVLALNMLSRTIDPIVTLADCGKLGIDDPAAFTYFAYGGRGFVAGMVDFFPHPFEPDGCASRLLGRSGGLQRLLAVSEDVDAMTGIREVLGRVRCSTATAFDGRQAMDLLPMIKPEVVLVDLSLPRGEGLRVVSRICTDPKTASIGVALFWTQPITQKDIAQAALRVVRDYALTPEDLGRHLTRVLNDDEFGLVAGEGIRVSA